MKRVAGFVLLASLVAGVTPTAAAPLSLETFFTGKLTAKGQVENLREGGTRPFTIDMAAHWDGPVGTLVEDVAFADGERQHKVWTFTKTGPGHFVGRREDLTRDADVVEGDASVRMTYKAKVKTPSGSTWNLSFDDSLKQVNKDTVTAESDISYLFIPAARLTMTITRHSTK